MGVSTGCVIILPLVYPQSPQGDQSNILMDATGHARITDFGLAMIAQYPDSTRRSPNPNARWIAPEILMEEGTYSKEADVFSFAGVTIEVRCRRST